jgi:hypothetical protein
MTTAYTSLLGLALPVTGELSGTWGDTVNNGITSLLDAAIAGTTTLSTDADVTLSNNDGTADTSRQAILLCTGARTAIRTITAPALSKIYTVINSTTGGFSVQIVAAGPTTGVTIVAGEAALIAWNGSDFIKVSNTGGSFTTQNLTVTGNTILGDAITDTTTLNAQTRFQSRAILGYANMTGPASTSLSTTAPAFLYSGATTYTVSDVSGGTQAFAPIISLGQATITNATTNTIYTNASTLYIAGAPSAGTNITITNPYALYVNAGASYLGGATTITAQLTASTGDGTYPIISKDTRAFSAGVTGPQLGFFGLDSTSTNNSLGAIRALAQTSQNGTLEARVLSGGSITTIGTFSSTGLAVTGTGSFTNIVNITRTGTTNLQLESPTGGSGISFRLAGVDKWGFGRGIVDNSNTLQWYDNDAGSTRMTLDASGNLGIGASPAQTLHVKTSTAATPITLGVLSNATGLPALSFNGAYASSTMAGIYGNGATASNLYYTVPASQSHFFAIADSAKMTLDASGNLGIGVTSITQKLQVLGNISAFSSSNVGSAGSAIYYLGAADAKADAQFKYDSSTRNLSWKTAAGASDMMTLDSSGNLGLGVTPKSSGNGVGYLEVANGGVIGAQGGSLQIGSNVYATSGTFKYASSNYATLLSQISGAYYFGIAPSGTAGNAISFTTAMTLDANGNLLVGTTGLGTIGSSSGFQITPSGAMYSASTGDSVFSRRSANGTVITFRRDTTTVGSIDVTTTATSYVTSSDYRLKNTIAPMTGALAKVAALKPVTYKWNVDGSDGEGFIAHELAEVVPQCVTGEKDAVDADGNPKYQGIDTSFLVATLTAAIQEQQALITQLTARITALEGA